jgi:hypothetical protein
MHTNFYLTKRGAEIGNAIFHPHSIMLSDTLRQSYIQSIIAVQVAVYHEVTIASPKQAGSSAITFTLKIREPVASPPSIADLAVIDKHIANVLRDVLAWAAPRYEIAMETPSAAPKPSI